MKIPESIIEKYQLTGSTAQIGESFIYNLQLFESGLAGFENIVFMECDFAGKPSGYIHLYNKANKCDGGVTPEYLTDSTPETILQLMS